MKGPAYLYENGTQLPEVFRDVLAALHLSFRSEGDLHEIIRKRAGLKETWILAHWESWEEFCDDILAALQDANLIEAREEKWVLTPRAVPGKRLTALHHPGEPAVIRVIFHGEQQERARESLAVARIRAGEFAFFLAGIQDAHPVLAGARARAEDIANILAKALQDPEEHPQRRSITGGQSEWYRQWVRVAGWHSTDDARIAWNEGHPGKFVDVAARCGFRTVQRMMVRDGLMETRSAIRKDGKGGGTEYRWKRE